MEVFHAYPRGENSVSLAKLNKNHLEQLSSDRHRKPKTTKTITRLINAPPKREINLSRLESRKAHSRKKRGKRPRFSSSYWPTGRHLLFDWTDHMTPVY